MDHIITTEDYGQIQLFHKHCSEGNLESCKNIYNNLMNSNFSLFAGHSFINYVNSDCLAWISSNGNLEFIKWIMEVKSFEYDDILLALGGSITERKKDVSDYLYTVIKKYTTIYETLHKLINHSMMWNYYDDIDYILNDFCKDHNISHNIGNKSLHDTDYETIEILFAHGKIEEAEIFFQKCSKCEYCGISSQKNIVKKMKENRKDLEPNKIELSNWWKSKINID